MIEETVLGEPVVRGITRYDDYGYDYSYREEFDLGQKRNTPLDEPVEDPEKPTEEVTIL